jgi:hypothetical protein
LEEVLESVYGKYGRIWMSTSIRGGGRRRKGRRGKKIEILLEKTKKSCVGCILISIATSP